MTETEIARQIFSAMPDDVFDIWLRPIVGRMGWPFRTGFESTAGSEWQRVLDHQPIQTIAQLAWQRQDIPTCTIVFEPRSDRIIHGLTACHRDGRDNVFADMRGSRERYHAFHKLSAQTGRVPAPVVLMLDHHAYRILDGNHRTAALMAQPNVHVLALDAWVGS